MYNFIEKGTFHLKVIILLWYCGRADYPVGFYIIVTIAVGAGFPPWGSGHEKAVYFKTVSIPERSAEKHPYLPACVLFVARVLAWNLDTVSIGKIDKISCCELCLQAVFFFGCVVQASNEIKCRVTHPLLILAVAIE